MDCSQFKSNLVTFREGILTENLRGSFEEHAKSCSDCSRVLSAFNELEVIIAHEKACEPNPFAATRILQRLENELGQSKKRTSFRGIRILQPVALAMALLCGIFIGSYTAKKNLAPATQLVSTSENIELLRSSLFIPEFADEDKILVLNK